MHKALLESYERCGADGMFLPQEHVDLARVRAMLRIAEEDLKTITDLQRLQDRWNTLYKLSYDVIHTLADALLRLDKMKTVNHQCLFSYLCTHHTEFDWAFFEQIRTRRNGIHYYGEIVSEQHWKEIALQVELYTNLLLRTVRQQLA